MNTARIPALVLSLCMPALLGCVWWLVPAGPGGTSATSIDSIPRPRTSAPGCEHEERWAEPEPPSEAQTPSARQPCDPLPASPSHVERVDRAVRELAADLRAEFFDLPTWDLRARSLARRLAVDAREALAPRLARTDAPIEELVAAGELLLLCEPITVVSASRLAPPVEARLLRAIEDRAVEPRLALAAARPLARLGSAYVRQLWLQAAASDDPALGPLALRALQGARGEALADDLIGALSLATSDIAGRRLVTLLDGMGRAGTADLSAGTRDAACGALEVLARGESAGMRSRAERALAAWRGEEIGGIERQDGVFVARGDGEALARATLDALDPLRPAAERRRAVIQLATQGAPAESSLARILLDDRDASVRSAAAAALARGEPGPLARDALALARSIDSSPAVRRQAEQGLRR